MEDWLSANANAAGPIFERDLAQMRKRVLSSEQARGLRSAPAAGTSERIYLRRAEPRSTRLLRASSIALPRWNRSRPSAI